MMAFSSGLRVPTISAQKERERERERQERVTAAGRAPGPGPRLMREEGRSLQTGSQTPALAAWASFAEVL